MRIAFPRAERLCVQLALYRVPFSARRSVLKDYILEDLRLHADIALAWLYEEYAQLQGFQQGGAAPPIDKLAGSESYVHCLNGLLKDVLHKCEPRERDA